MNPVEGIETPRQPEAGPSKPKRRFVGSTKPRPAGSSIRRIVNQIPDDILNDSRLNAAIAQLPRNYNFEIHKTIHHIRRDGIKTVALQMPEGLMVYGCAIADIIEDFTGALPLLLADVTYGACCIDDFTAKEMGAEMIVHYGHSCLIPVSQTSIKTLYIFVEIGIDTDHLSSSVRRNFPSNRHSLRQHILNPTEVSKPGSTIPITLDPDDQPNEDDTKTDELPTRLALVSTVQFVASIQTLKDNLTTSLPPLEKEKEEEREGDQALSKMKKKDIGVWRGKYEITIPQSKPLSPGEVLGCTAPKLTDVDALIYVGDGRFHLESIMIANPTVPAFRYDPYSKKFTRETYEHQEMRMVRGDAVRKARQTLVERPDGTASVDGVHREPGAGSWAVVLGTLGRQGSLSVLKTIQSYIPSGPSSNPPFMLLLSELSPQKLSLFPQISTFVQTSCPRLSIDWGYAFDRPLLSPYEASVALGRIKGWKGIPSLDRQGLAAKEAGETGKGDGEGEGDYPMDFYADKNLGPWTPRHRAETVKAA